MDQEQNLKTPSTGATDLATDKERDLFPAGRCYDCFRPIAFCFCRSIPRIENQTEVLILQHRRERFHPFNTARIVKKALQKSQLLADHIESLAVKLRLSPKACLLFPGPTSRLVSDLNMDERPDQLVVLDGTWHHAKTLLRDIPALQMLPRIQLAPTEPSRYRIRREPNELALSTVEAAVAALRILEPSTVGFELLLKAFDTMIEEQLAHPGSERGARFRANRNRTVKNIPLALTKNLDNVVVAYGESAAGEKGLKRGNSPPLSWVAQRLSNLETFSCLMKPTQPLANSFLEQLELTNADFDEAISLDEARNRWAKFQRPNDVVAVFYPRTVRLFSHLASEPQPCVVLKSVNLPTQPSEIALDHLAASLGRPMPTDNIPKGRAGRRLANTIAFVKHLNSVAQNRLHLNSD